MATTAKPIVPESKASGQKGRKPLTKAHKQKLVSALDRWRASLTPEQKAELAEQQRQKHQANWAAMPQEERDARLAGVRAWQQAQREKKQAEAKPKPAPKVGAKNAPQKGSRRTERGERTARARAVEVIGPDGTSKPSKANNVLANRKAAGK
jgi:hypothetical protein